MVKPQIGGPPTRVSGEHEKTPHHHAGAHAPCSAPPNTLGYKKWLLRTTARSNSHTCTVVVCYHDSVSTVVVRKEGPDGREDAGERRSDGVEEPVRALASRWLTVPRKHTTRTRPEARMPSLSRGPRHPPTGTSTRQQPRQQRAVLSFDRPSFRSWRNVFHGDLFCLGFKNSTPLQS